LKYFILLYSIFHTEMHEIGMQFIQLNHRSGSWAELGIFMGTESALDL
jgi:hypothetical protein